MYRNISGTTISKDAMKFACSDTVPCSKIALSDINLEKEDDTVETYCNSAEGFAYGVVHPSADCLSPEDTDCTTSDLIEIIGATEPERDHIVRTEL